MFLHVKLKSTRNLISFHNLSVNLVVYTFYFHFYMSPTTSISLRFSILALTFFQIIYFHTTPKTVDYIFNLDLEAFFHYY